MTYIGIDPGKDGAMTILREGAEPEIVHFSVGYLKYLRMLSGAKSICYLEQVHSMPRDSHKTAFSFGENYGWIRGILEALHIPYQTVPPQTWKKEFSLSSDKAKSIECAKRLFPNVSLFRTDKCKTEHDGMAESLLIAEYGRRKYGR